MGLGLTSNDACQDDCKVRNFEPPRAPRTPRKKKEGKKRRVSLHHAFLLGALGVLGGFYDFAILL